MKYASGIGLIILAVFLAIGLALGLRLLFAPFPLALIGAYLTLHFGYGVVFGNKVYSIGLLNLPTSILCDEHGIEVKYWIRFPRRVSWNEVCGLETARTSSLWCRVRCCKDSPLFPIVLPIGGIWGSTGFGESVARKRNWAFWFGGSATLIKTVLERASLQFVEGFPEGYALYKRFDAENNG